MPERLHYLMVRHVVETGHAPDLATLATLAGCTEDETARRLRLLDQMHGVVLAPNSLNVWSLHPFALTPTRFWVTTDQGGWWANCAWCSLGIGAALHQDVTISTGDGAEGESLGFRVEAGRSTRPGVLMHFPYPPARSWDNPYSPCGNILFFSAQAKIGAWCTRHGRPKGAVLDIETGILLAERWFGDYAMPEWRRKTREQALAVFTELRLDPSFWNMDGL
jgi:hypothetical protein